MVSEKEKNNAATCILKVKNWILLTVGRTKILKSGEKWTTQCLCVENLVSFVSEYGVVFQWSVVKDCGGNLVSGVQWGPRVQPDGSVR